MSKERVAVMDADIFVYKVAQAAILNLLFVKHVLNLAKSK